MVEVGGSCQQKGAAVMDAEIKILWFLVVGLFFMMARGRL